MWCHHGGYMKNVIVVLVAILISYTTYANAIENQNIPTIDGIATINVGSIKAIESNGNIYFMSENGRFVIQGNMTDTWHKKKLVTLKDIDYAAKHINIKKMGLPIDELNVITIGKGKKEIIIFVDPQCEVCKKFFYEAKNRLNDYTFKFIVVPALGDDSNKIATAMFCSKDKSNIEKHFLNGTLLELEQKEVCDKKYYDLSLTIAQLIGIKYVPFFIAPNGLYKAGSGKDFWIWVENAS